jgi:hypothetical protein
VRVYKKGTSKTTNNPTAKIYLGMNIHDGRYAYPITEKANNSAGSKGKSCRSVVFT